MTRARIGSGAGIGSDRRLLAEPGTSEGLVFPSPSRPGKTLSDMTLTKLLRDSGLSDRATVHGFRTSFRTWASERTSVPHAVCEMALAHRVGSDVERSYARSDLFEKRRGLMDQWAEYVTGGGAKVATPACQLKSSASDTVLAASGHPATPTHLGWPCSQA